MGGVGAVTRLYSPRGEVFSRNRRHDRLTVYSSSRRHDNVFSHVTLSGPIPPLGFFFPLKSLSLKGTCRSLTHLTGNGDKRATHGGNGEKCTGDGG
jgi:hypothetical protein